MIFLLSLFIQMASAEWLGSWSLEAAYGVTQQTLENPNSSDAIYSGYGGHALIAASLVRGENFNLSPFFKYFHSELDNKANSLTLAEEMKSYGLAPGLEFQFNWFFVSYAYRFQRISIETSGNFQNKISSNFEGGEFGFGVEVPIDAWALRLCYSQTHRSLPSADTGLAADTPRVEQSLSLAIRYNFQWGRRRDPWEREIQPSSSESNTPSTTTPRLYRRSFRQNYSDRSNYLND